MFWEERKNYPSVVVDDNYNQLVLCRNCGCYYVWEDELTKVEGTNTGPCCLQNEEV